MTEVERYKIRNVGFAVANALLDYIEDEHHIIFKGSTKESIRDEVICLIQNKIAQVSLVKEGEE